MIANTAQFLEEQIAKPGLLDRWRAFRHDGGRRAGFCGLDGRRFREDSFAAFIPGATGIDLAMVASARGIVDFNAPLPETYR
ncbi:hypothetical protein ABIA96_003633 [Bradyrhizobium sp. LB11.1]|jgi:hypothetical protein